jgi:hypothetical protein
MGDDKKKKNLLLVDVPDDIVVILEAYKKKKADECGCRFGNSQAVYNMLRKYRILVNMGNLQDATTT